MPRDGAASGWRDHHHRSTAAARRIIHRRTNRRATWTPPQQPAIFFRGSVILSARMFRDRAGGSVFSAIRDCRFVAGVRSFSFSLSLSAVAKVGSNKRRDISLLLRLRRNGENAREREHGTSDNRPPNRKCESCCQLALLVVRGQQ